MPAAPAAPVEGLLEAHERVARQGWIRFQSCGAGSYLARGGCANRAHPYSSTGLEREHRPGAPRVREQPEIGRRRPARVGDDAARADALEAGAVADVRLRLHDRGVPRGRRRAPRTPPGRSAGRSPSARRHRCHRRARVRRARCRRASRAPRDGCSASSPSKTACDDALEAASPRCRRPAPPLPSVSATVCADARGVRRGRRTRHRGCRAAMRPSPPTRRAARSSSVLSPSVPALVASPASASTHGSGPASASRSASSGAERATGQERVAQRPGDVHHPLGRAAPRPADRRPS